VVLFLPKAKTMHETYKSMQISLLNYIKIEIERAKMSISNHTQKLPDLIIQKIQFRFVHVPFFKLVMHIYYHK
jgi:hypothetical protein